MWFCGIFVNFNPKGHKNDWMVLCKSLKPVSCGALVFYEGLDWLWTQYTVLKIPDLEYKVPSHEKDCPPLYSVQIYSWTLKQILRTESHIIHVIYLFFHVRFYKNVHFSLLDISLVSAESAQNLLKEMSGKIMTMM